MEICYVNELISIVIASAISSLAVLGYTFMIENTYPRSIYIIYWLLLTAFIGGSRFVLRAFKDVAPTLKKANDSKNVMIIGAGDAGSMVIEEFIRHPELNRKPAVIVDDDTDKHGMRIHGVKVVGDRSKILEMTRKEAIKEIIIAMPSIDRREIRDIVDICRKTKCKIRMVPEYMN